MERFPRVNDGDVILEMIDVQGCFACSELGIPLHRETVGNVIVISPNRTVRVRYVEGRVEIDPKRAKIK